MTYSSGSSGYQPTQPPGSYGAPSPFGPPAEPGPSKLPFYLTIAVLVLGFLVYLFNFGPTYGFSGDIGEFAGSVTGGNTGYPILAALAAGLLAGVGLLPKAKSYQAIAAVLATIGALLVISEVVLKPAVLTIGWALWVVLALAILQAIAAIAALLLDSGVITAPVPRPKYEQPQYGQYGPPAGYYGQPAPNQRPGGPGPGGPGGYPQQQYGGYPQQQPPTSAFGAQPGPQHGGPPTPPTGYPSFSPPPAVGSGQGGPISPSAPTQQAQQPTPPPSNGPSPS
jgi:hypothetical protein